MGNKERFRAAYSTALASAVREHPEKYCYGPDAVPGVVAKMMAALEARSFNHDGLGLRRACKALGIRQTQRDILAFYHGGAA